MKERKRRSVLQSARADGDGMRRPPGHGSFQNSKFPFAYAMCLFNDKKRTQKGSLNGAMGTEVCT